MSVHDAHTASQDLTNQQRQAGDADTAYGVRKRQAHGGGVYDCFHIEMSVTGMKVPASAMMDAPEHSPIAETDNGRHA